MGVKARVVRWPVFFGNNSAIMEKEKIQIQDESNDHKYFTVIPNYILNHSSHWDREVFIQMRRITGERGTCYTSIGKLMKQCGFCKERLNKSLKYLVDHKWISYLGKKEIQTQGGSQFVNEYRVNDIWKLNTDFYTKGGSSDDLPFKQRGVVETTKGGSPSDYKEEPYEEDKNNATKVAPSSEVSLNANPSATPEPTPPPPFDSRSYLEKAESDKREHVKLIATCAIEMGRKFPSEKAVSGFIARNSRVAMELKEYPIETIFEAIDAIKGDRFYDKINWGLETILKKIAK